MWISRYIVLSNIGVACTVDRGANLKTKMTKKISFFKVGVPNNLRDSN